MTPDEERAAILNAVRDDTNEWIDVFGRKYLKALQRQSPRAVAAVAELMATAPENYVKLNCCYLLSHADTPEAADALAAVLDRSLDDEVLEQIFEDAVDWPSLRGHAGLVAKARALYPRWPNPSLRDFLRRADDRRVEGAPGAPGDFTGGHAARMKTKPNVEIVEVYDDNVFGQGVVSAKIRVTRPGMGAKVKGKPSQPHSFFPDGWTDSRIVDAIKEVCGGPANFVSADGAAGACKFRKVVGGIPIEGFVEGGQIVAGFPRVPKVVR